MTKITSKAERLAKIQSMIAGERKAAEKAGEETKIGQLKDFKITGLNNFVFTSVLGLDLNTNGIKKGTVSVLYGAESSGKSTLALETIAGIQMQEPDALIIYMDAEQTVDESFMNRITNLNKENIFFIKETIIEKAFNQLFEFLKDGLFDYIVVDSVDSMSTIKEMEKGLDEAVMMEKARVLSRAFPELNRYMAEYGIATIFIQQERVEFMGQIAKPKGRSGGKAMRFYPASTTQLSKVAANNDKEKDIFENDRVVTQYCKIKNDKSKISEPYKETFTYINLNREKKVGVEKMKECVGYASYLGIIKKGGAWFEFVTKDGEIKKVQGENKVLQFLSKSIDTYSYMKIQVYAKGIPPELFITKYDDLINMIKVENKFMKKNRDNMLKLLGKEIPAEEREPEEFEIVETSAKDFLTEEQYKKGQFNLLSIEEQEKMIKELEKDNKEKEIEERKKIVEAQNEDIIEKEKITA